MLRALRQDAARGPLATLARGTISVFVSLALLAPGAFAGSACGMDAEGSGCPRCTAQPAAEATPPCHAKAEPQPARPGCHEGDAAGACCELQARDVPMLEVAAYRWQASLQIVDAALAPAPDWFSPTCHAPTSPCATESPPGTSGLLVAQTATLRL